MRKHIVMVSILPLFVSSDLSPRFGITRKNLAPRRPLAPRPHTVDRPRSPDATCHPKRQRERGSWRGRPGTSGVLSALLQPVPRRAAKSPSVCRAFGEKHTHAKWGCATHLQIFKESQNLGVGEMERLGDHATPAEAGQVLPPPPTTQVRTDGLPGERPCVPGAYLGRGSGEEPAGRWRGEACCLRARRGWGCSGHLHCLQTEEQGQRTEGGEGKQRKAFQA